MNGTTDTNGKAPMDGSSTPSARANEPLVNVQPPKREDLQPSYAQVIKADSEDAAQHGWYGSEFDDARVYDAHRTGWTNGDGQA